MNSNTIYHLTVDLSAEIIKKAPPSLDWSEFHFYFTSELSMQLFESMLNEAFQGVKIPWLRSEHIIWNEGRAGVAAVEIITNIFNLSNEAEKTLTKFKDHLNKDID